jgi:orotidine-5'-phosphate decarboxylase
MTALDNLRTRIKEVNSALCVGLDPDLDKIPEQYVKTKNPVFEFNKFIIEETHEHAAAYKPNSAFYEALGTPGWEQLQQTISYIKSRYPQITVILDAKRADIGSTSAAYAKAAFDVLGADAVTVSPYLGSDALEPFISRKDKIMVVLCKTSNPGSGEIQDLKIGEKPLWQHVAFLANNSWNVNQNLMLVVGATFPEELKAARKIAGDIPFLVPGVGAQGGDLALIMQVENILVNIARDINYAADPKAKAGFYVQQMRQYAKIG